MIDVVFAGIILVGFIVAAVCVTRNIVKTGGDR